jgi:hypothetical protein
MELEQLENIGLVKQMGANRNSLQYLWEMPL